MTSRRPRPTDASSWLPAAAAGLVLALVVGIGVFASGNGTDANAEAEAEADQTSTAITTPATDSVGVVTAPVVNAASSGAPLARTATPLAAPLSLGSAGNDVRRVQERLAELGFQPGPADGQFGSGTQQAVWAFKKLVDTIAWEDFAARDDQTVVTDDVWQQMADPSVRFLPRRPGAGTHVEIYLPLQVMAVFRDDVAIFISHISSGELRPDGEPATFCETAPYDTDEPFRGPSAHTFPDTLTSGPRSKGAKRSSEKSNRPLPILSRKSPRSR